MSSIFRSEFTDSGILGFLLFDNLSFASERFRCPVRNTNFDFVNTKLVREIPIMREKYSLLNGCPVRLWSGGPLCSVSARKFKFSFWR